MKALPHWGAVCALTLHKPELEVYLCELFVV